MENDIIVEEMERQSVCKPDCESWSYEEAKASHYTEKGKLTLNLSKGIMFFNELSFIFVRQSVKWKMELCTSVFYGHTVDIA